MSGHPNPKLALGSIPRRWVWLLASILLLGLALRIWSIDYDLPYVFHPDEPVTVAIAQRIFKTGDWNPHFFSYPSLSFYLNALVYWPYYLAGKVMGVFHSRADVPALDFVELGAAWTPMPSSILLGRLLNAAFGVGSVLLVFLIGRQVTHRREVGLLAALLMAISPTNVSQSRFIVPNTFTVFFVLLAFWMCVCVVQQGKTWQYVLAGIASGLAISSKYNVALVMLCLFAAHFLRYGRGGFKDWRLYVTPVLTAFTFLVTTPYALLDFSSFVDGVQLDAAVYSTGSPGMEGDSVQWYLVYLWQFEGPTCAFAVFEMVHGVLARKKEILLLAVFPVIYFSFIGSFVVRNDRIAMPLTPFLFMLGASFLVGLWGWLTVWYPRLRSPALVSAAAILVCLALPLKVTAESANQLTTVDSRRTAAAWIDQNLPRGSRIALEAYGPYIDPQHFAVEGVGRTIDQPLDWYIAHGFEYIVFGQGMYGRYYADPTRYSRQITQYDDLFGSLEMVKTFTDGGREIRVYRLAKQ